MEKVLKTLKKGGNEGTIYVDESDKLPVDLQVAADLGLHARLVASIVDVSGRVMDERDQGIADALKDKVFCLASLQFLWMVFLFCFVLF